MPQRKFSILRKCLECFLKPWFHGVGVPQLVPLGLGWSEKGKGFHVSKLDRGVKIMREQVETTWVSNVLILHIDPTQMQGLN